MAQNAKSQSVVIVTGAGHGIGSATAQRFAADGWRVIVADKDKMAADRVAAHIDGYSAAADGHRRVHPAADHHQLAQPRPAGRDGV